MEENVQKPKLKKKAKTTDEVVFKVGDTFETSSAKDKDFDLDLDAAKFQGKKGQAGTRTTSPEDTAHYYFSN